MYKLIDVHIPEKYQEGVKCAITQDRPVGVKINLQKEPNATILATPRQLTKFNRSIAANKNALTLRMSKKQVKANLKHEEGFLSMLLSFATKVLPKILSGLSSGLLSGLVEKGITGNRLFLCK